MERVILCPTASDRDNRSKTMQELREKLPPCPICGRKPYLLHNVFDGADFGYSVGCKTYHYDGLHTVLASSFTCDSKEEAFETWVKYCERFKEKKK